MRITAIKQHISILECNAEDLQGQIAHLESNAVFARESNLSIHPSLAELLEGIRNLLAITKRTIQRAKESL